MSTFLDHLFLKAQAGQFNVKFLTAQTVDPAVIFGVLGGIVLAIALGIYISYRYKKWCTHRTFNSEMQQLGLNPNQEGTFGDLVKHYKMKDPVQVLYSLRMFDEMAALEIVRVLGSPGPISAKEDFIDALYEIRQITYLSDGIEAVATAT